MLDDCLAATGTDSDLTWIILAVGLVVVGVTLTLLGRKLGFNAGLALVVGLVIALGAGSLVGGTQAEHRCARPRGPKFRGRVRRSLFSKPSTHHSIRSIVLTAARSL